MSFGELIGATGIYQRRDREPYVPYTRRKGNPAFWWVQFLRNADFYLTAKNPPLIQFEPISGYMDSLGPTAPKLGRS